MIELKDPQLRRQAFVCLGWCVTSAKIAGDAESRRMLHERAKRVHYAGLSWQQAGLSTS